MFINFCYCHIHLTIQDFICDGLSNCQNMTNGTTVVKYRMN